MTSPSPLASRIELGRRLRSYREDAKLLIADAAVALECSQSKVSRLETGKGRPRARDVRDLLELYGVKDEAVRHELEGLALAGRADEWWREYEDVVRSPLFAEHLLPYAEAEQEATSLRTFEPEIVPGLLQAPPYIEAVAAFFYPDSDDEERSRLIEFRLRRQQALRATGRTFGFVVGEAALQRAIGGPAAMGAQMESLHKSLESELAHVDFRVLPFDSTPPASIGGPFVVLRFADSRRDCVYIEGREDATYLTGDERVDRYEAKFEQLVDAALDRDASLERLAAMVRQWQRKV
ncbi:MAG: helix-turn-helix domain-containing protein [Pseudonocardia sp.]